MQETNNKIVWGLSMMQILEDISNPTYKEVGEIKKKIMNCLSEDEKQWYEKMRPYQQRRFLRNKFLYIMGRGKCN